MDAENLTDLLLAWKHGDEAALDQLYPVVERELRRIASRRVRRERKNHTLQTTALVNEAFVKLCKGSVQWQNRAHFFAVSARVMRNILINYARDSKATRRGGGVARVDLEQVAVISSERNQELLDLDDALKRLAKMSKVKAEIVELRYFGGMSIDETAEVLGISASSVSLHWRLARAWLQRELGNGGD
ncbi:MAG: sigma-70 family RNA polymerase sigma factor [Acidobacteria bacterium]|nr:sigma-70 family RNA polymerase sigma factor [Acidobacteriota bacterium]